MYTRISGQKLWYSGLNGFGEATQWKKNKKNCFRIYDKGDIFLGAEVY